LDFLVFALMMGSVSGKSRKTEIAAFVWRNSSKKRPSTAAEKKEKSPSSKSGVIHSAKAWRNSAWESRARDREMQVALGFSGRL